MKYFKKAFLFVVGLVTMTFDEVVKDVEEARKMVKNQSEKIVEAVK